MENEAKSPLGLHQLFCDMQVTRRKRFHTVADPEGRSLFKSKLISDCFAYLHHNGITRYECVPDDDRAPELPLLTIQEEELPPWQN